MDAWTTSWHVDGSSLRFGKGTFLTSSLPTHVLSSDVMKKHRESIFVVDDETEVLLHPHVQFMLNSGVHGAADITFVHLPGSFGPTLPVLVDDGAPASSVVEGGFEAGMSGAEIETQAGVGFLIGAFQNW
jgi:hypothetical protein